MDDAFSSHSQKTHDGRRSVGPSEILLFVCRAQRASHSGAASENRFLRLLGRWRQSRDDVTCQLVP